MEIKPLQSFYEVRFPLYIASSTALGKCLKIIYQDPYKYVVRSHKHPLIVDYITDSDSTYLGRLMTLMQNKVQDVLQYHYTFLNFAHYVYGRPTLDPDCLIADSRGKFFVKGPIWATRYYVPFKKRVENYLYVSPCPYPLYIPDNPLLIESLDNYKPMIEIIDYHGTWFFRNIHSVFSGIPMKPKRIRIL